MARFADGKDIEASDRCYVPSKECVNCKCRDSHTSAEGTPTCSRCFTNPNIKIKLDGRHSFGVFNTLRTGRYDLLNDDIRCQHFPDRQLFFSLLRQKRLIDECNYTLIVGYATEEANYIYDISCFTREIDVINYLKKSFSEPVSEEPTYHVVKIFDRGKPVDFDIVIKH